MTWRSFAMDASATGRLTALLIVIAVVIDSLEMLTSRSEYAKNGMFAPQFIASRKESPNSRSDLFVRSSLEYPRFLLLPFCNLIAAACIPVFLGVDAGILLLWILVARILLAKREVRNGSEGSDQMLNILLGSLACFYLIPTVVVQRSVLWFIAGQTILAYTASGFSKIMNPDWRNGKVLARIFATDIFQFPYLVPYLRSSPRIARIAAWSVLVFECGCLVFLFADSWTCCLFLLLGIIFHGFIAVTQGLNLFFWVFLATYPALWFLSLQVHLH